MKGIVKYQTHAAKRRFDPFTRCGKVMIILFSIGDMRSLCRTDKQLELIKRYQTFP